MTISLPATSRLTKFIQVELDDPRWKSLVESHDSASIFHHPAWTSVLADCYGYRSLILLLRDTHGDILAGLPVIETSSWPGGHRWISLPFTDHCQPLSEGPLEAGLTDALVTCTEHQGVRAFEIHADLPSSEGISYSTAFVRHTLALCESPSTVFTGFAKQHRKNVRRSERANVKIRRGTSLSDVETFFDLHTHTRRRLGVPVQPRRLFKLLHERLIDRGLGFVLSAYAGNAPVAAAVFLCWNGVLTCKYSASDPAYTKLFPNYLLFWTAIRWGCENGFRALDFGRTDLGHSGLREFKRGWGAKEELLRYSTIANSEPRLARDHSLGFTSARVQKAAGYVIRNSPPWVCRVLGELFYRYAT